MVIVSFMSPPARNCIRSICTQTNKTSRCATCAPHPHTALPRYKFILSPIYIHNRNVTQRMNKPSAVILTRKKNPAPLDRWRSVVMLCSASSPSSHVRNVFRDLSYDRLALTLMLSSHQKFKNFFEGAAPGASILCHGLTSKNAISADGSIQRLSPCHHRCQLLTVGGWHWSHPVRNRHSQKGYEPSSAAFGMGSMDSDSFSPRWIN